MGTKKLCVIGDPIEHSKSPLIQNTMINHLGIDYYYDYQRVVAGDIKSWIEKAKNLGYVGFNATMPHKVDILPYIDVMDDEAKLYNAVNTVSFKGDKIYGYNTDGIGFLQSLLEKGVSPKDKTVTILGAGGASSAVALKMVKEGAKTVKVLNRSLDKAENLCKRFSGKMQSFDFAVDTLKEQMKDTDILINGTSLGMGGVSADYEDLSFVEALPKTATVCDLIYFPKETSLLKKAKEQELNTVGGIGMLIYQAIYALSYMTDKKLDVEEMAKILEFL